MANNACVLILSPLKSTANDQIKEAFNGDFGWLANRLLNDSILPDPCVLHHRETPIVYFLMPTIWDFEALTLAVFIMEGV